MTEARRTPLEAQTTVLLEAHTTVLPPDNTYPLFIVGTRYRLPSPHLAAFRHVDPSAPTLVLLHAIGFHKEVWEPTIAALLGAAGPAVQEAWAIECPNHGASAGLNRERLGDMKLQSAGYAAAAHRFLENVADLRSRPLVGIGHSLGGIALTILQRIPPLLPFTSLIIVEPVLLAVPRPRIERLRVRLRGRALGRKDAWRTREAAEAYFRKAPWDGRVVDLFVEHGLVRDDRRGGVTLACSREQEETMYMDMYGPTAPLDYLPQMCSDIPVHLVLGSPNDVMAADLHAALLTGRIPWTSVARIPQAGHFVPMDAPDALAVVLAGMLPRIEGLRAPGIQREREQRVHEAYAMEMARREEGAPVVVARL